MNSSLFQLYIIQMWKVLYLIFILELEGSQQKSKTKSRNVKLLAINAFGTQHKLMRYGLVWMFHYLPALRVVNRCFGVFAFGWFSSLKKSAQTWKLKNEIDWLSLWRVLLPPTPLDNPRSVCIASFLSACCQKVAKSTSKIQHTTKLYHIWHN